MSLDCKYFARITDTFLKQTSGRWSATHVRSSVAHAFSDALTIARIPALIGSGSFGQASARIVKPGSALGSSVPSAPVSAPPCSETLVFPVFPSGVRVPPHPLVVSQGFANCRSPRQTRRLPRPRSLGSHSAPGCSSSKPPAADNAQCGATRDQQHPGRRFGDGVPDQVDSQPRLGRQRVERAVLAPR